MEILQAVPVRPRPKMRTFMGTVRRHSRLLISVSAVKISVMGFGMYFAEYAILSGKKVFEKVQKLKTEMKFQNRQKGRKWKNRW